MKTKSTLITRQDATLRLNTTELTNLAGVSAKVTSFDFARAPHDKTNIECPGLRYIDFFCYKNDSCVWESNHYVKKCYSQEISGQPYKSMGG